MLYFLQAQIVAREMADRVARTVYFAHVDIWVNSLTLIAQFVITQRLLVTLGVGRTLMMLPIISVVGFSGLALRPCFRR